MRHRFLGEPEKVYKFNGEEVTKEDLHHLYRQGERLSVQTIAELFDTKPLTIYIQLRKFHINPRKEDSAFYWEMEKINETNKKDRQQRVHEEWQVRRKEEDDLLWEKAKEMYGKPRPEPRVFMIKGKRYVDNDLVKDYEKRVCEIYNQLKKHGVTKTKELSRIRSVDLSAMRLHRGLDMYKFADQSGIPYKHVTYYEKTRGIVVPTEISDIYMNILNISARELRKIKECLSGDRKSMFEEDSREIPESVREYVVKRDKGQCTRCRTDRFLHFHHIEHFSKGGTHQVKNLKLLCVGCHALEHYGERGFAMLKAQAERVGVEIDVSRKAEKKRV